MLFRSRDEARGEAAAAELRARGFPSVRFHRLDVTDPASVAAFASWIRYHVGGLDILVSRNRTIDQTCGPFHPIFRRQVLRLAPQNFRNMFFLLLPAGLI